MTFPSLRPPRSRRSGSALIIVLGILSILLVMSVTFSALVRTERGGTTNLKNSQIAREALQSALVQAMEAIEQSFDNPTNNWPVPCWPYPWIASAQEPGDDVAAFDSGAFSGLYYQSGHVEDGAPDAHVMFPGMSSFLTPAQVALVRSAKCGWSPLRASIAATSDGVVGRCAYVALDTTGYLDANVVHRYPDDRAETLGEDPYAFKLPSDSDNLKDIHGKKIPCSLTSPTQFASARAAAKSFLSFADLRHFCSSKDVDRTRDEKGKFPALNLEPPSNTTDPFPADLFCFSSLSLDELAPNGQPKIALPFPKSEKKDAECFENGNDCGKWAARALRAMVEVFARSRKNAGLKVNAVDEDSYTFFYHLPENDRLKISRARIATISLLDAFDKDSHSGRSDNMGAVYWDFLPDSCTVSVDGTAVADRQTGPKGKPLNFPATDSHPLLDRAYAYMHINKATAVIPNLDDVGGDINAQIEESYINYEGEIRVGGIASNLNLDLDGEAATYSLQVECEVLAGAPGKSASKPDPGDNKKILNQLKLGYPRAWTFGGNPASEASGEFLASTSNTESRDDICDRPDLKAKNRYVPVKAVIPFSVQARVDLNVVPDRFTVESSDPRDPDPKECFRAKVVSLSDAAEFKTIPVRAKFTLSQNGKAVQQVPAPALDTTAFQKSWWLCMNMGVPDNSNCSGLDSSEKFKGDGKEKVHENKDKNSPVATVSEAEPLPSRLGWAVCLAPVFGFDTSSLFRSGPTTGPELHPTMISPKTLLGRSWINDLWNSDPDAPKWVKDLADGIQKEDSRGNLPPAYQAAEEFEFIGAHDGETTDLGGLVHFLKFPFDAATYGQGYSEFASYGIPGAPVPDMHHSASSGGSPFVKSHGTKTEAFFSHIDNGPMTSAGQIGNVMCGPHETLSLYETYRNSSDHRPDFHRVLDYFTTSESRYPNEDDDGALNATGLGQSQVYSGVHHGRVNLNMPYLVQWSNKLMTRAKESDIPNLFPFVAAINGASCSALDPDRALPVSSAGLIAADFANSEHRFQHNRKFNCDRDMVFSVAELGKADADTKDNVLLRNLCDDPIVKPECDADREALLANAANAFTTRGQSFLVVIRADAYSPMFGMGADVKEGTSLATTHALVELWRDPEPARYADGSFPTDKDGNEVVYHNWQIRSFRIF